MKRDPLKTANAERARPGESSYSPVWKETILSWKKSAKPVLIKSDTQINQLEKKGGLSERSSVGSTARSSGSARAKQSETACSKFCCQNFCQPELTGAVSA